MVRTGTLWEVVFLMRTSGLLIRLGQTKKPLPPNPGYRGLLVYTTELGFVGINFILRASADCAVLRKSA